MGRRRSRLQGNLGAIGSRSRRGRGRGESSTPAQRVRDHPRDHPRGAHPAFVDVDEHRMLDLAYRAVLAVRASARSSCLFSRARTWRRSWAAQRFGIVVVEDCAGPRRSGGAAPAPPTARRGEL
jgi:hypothetical protein